MDEQEKKEFRAKSNLALNRFSDLSKKLQAEKKIIQDLCPIKVGDKVRIICPTEEGEDKFVRFAFVSDVKVKLRGKPGEEKARLEFSLEKCKVDGAKSLQSDFLRFNEVIQRIS